MKIHSLNGHADGRFKSNRSMITRNSPRSKSLSPSGGALHVVGVGASVGGLESLVSLLHAVPADSGMALVMIQQLSPKLNNHIEARLSRPAAIPLRRVENGMRVEPNAIYLFPAQQGMVISEGRLLLAQRSADRLLPRPIDRFFRSLVNDCGRYAIAEALVRHFKTGGLAKNGRNCQRKIRRFGVICESLPF